MVTRQQENCLRRFRGWATGWEKPAGLAGCSPPIWDALVAAGYLEEKYEGGERLLRVTEKGKRAIDEGLF